MGHFKFKSQEKADGGKSIKQLYSGNFAGFQSDNIELDFDGTKLFVVGVTLPTQDTRPASKRWQELADATAQVHGQPTNVTPPPSTGSMRDVVEKYPDTPNRQHIQALAAFVDDSNQLAGVGGFSGLDRKVENGEWKPMAMWKFRNKAMILIMVQVDQPNRFGDRRLHPSWGAVGPDFEAWSKRNPMKPDV